MIKRGQASERQEVAVARISAFGIGAVAIVLAIFAQSLNVAFLVALAFAVAASGNLPAILYCLFWKRFNTSGAVWAIYGGLISAVVLVFFSPVVSGAPTAMFPDTRLALVPAVEPGHHLDPGRLPLRLARHGAVRKERDEEQVRRAGGPRRSPAPARTESAVARSWAARAPPTVARRQSEIRVDGR